MRIIVVTVVGLFACGTSETPEHRRNDQRGSAPEKPAAAAADVKLVDACTLLTKADVEQATRRKTLDPGASSFPAARATTCSFGDPASPLIDGKPLGKVVSVMLTTHPDAATARDTYEFVLSPNKERAEILSGIGDAAYWNTDPAFRDLTFIQGRYEVTVRIDESAGAREVATALARKAIGNLPVHGS